MMLLGHGAVYGEQYYTVAPPLTSVTWREVVRQVAENPDFYSISVPAAEAQKADVSK